MFHDSEICRPLYDTLNGGPPRAFECLIPCDTDDAIPRVFSCGKVCRTERGMKMHLKLVHHFEAQQCLFQKESAATQHAETKE